MQFRKYTDVPAFHRAAEGVLMRHEAQNILLLGNLLLGLEGTDKAGWRDPANWLMATVTEGAAVRLVALMTPPHNLTLYAADNRFDAAAVDCLVDGLRQAGVPVPGVTTETGLAEAFAGAYTGAVGQTYRIVIRQRIYELCSVSPAVRAVGRLRLAEPGDLAFLPYWMAGFQSDCFGSPFAISENAGEARYHIASQNLYVLEDGGTPVSMAKINRELQTVCCIGFVYTPPYFRGHGYATACVAAVSRQVLARGYRKCALYTDLANPVSNSIYRKIGYQPICDSLQIEFVPRG